MNKFYCTHCGHIIRTRMKQYKERCPICGKRGMLPVE